MSNEENVKVTVKLFAAARQIAGRDSIELDLPHSATIDAVRQQLEEQYPELRPLLRHAMFAMNAEYVPPDAQVVPHHEVVCIPPVSGG